MVEVTNISPASRKPHQVGAVGSEINRMSMLQRETRCETGLLFSACLSCNSSYHQPCLLVLTALNVMAGRRGTFSLARSSYLFSRATGGSRTHPRATGTFIPQVLPTLDPRVLSAVFAGAFVRLSYGCLHFPPLTAWPAPLLTTLNSSPS